MGKRFCLGKKVGTHLTATSNFFLIYKQFIIEMTRPTYRQVFRQAVLLECYLIGTLAHVLFFDVIPGIRRWAVFVCLPTSLCLFVCLLACLLVCVGFPPHIMTET